MTATSQFSLPTKPFYVADCAVHEASFVEKNGQYVSHISGNATLVSGELELEFNWVAKGGSTPQQAFEFSVSLNNSAPDFYLIGVEGVSEQDLAAISLQILAASQWQTEVAECLPKNAAELAALQ